MHLAPKKIPDKMNFLNSFSTMDHYIHHVYNGPCSTSKELRIL